MIRNYMVYIDMSKCIWFMYCFNIVVQKVIQLHLAKDTHTYTCMYHLYTMYIFCNFSKFS